MNTQFPDNYSSTLPYFGNCELLPFTPDDSECVWQWVRAEHAHFWGMQQHSLDEVRDFYLTLNQSTHSQAYLLYRDGKPIALTEIYSPDSDQVGKTYDVQSGDIGMHILLAPSTTREPNFSFHVMQFVMQALFSQRANLRVVVEPDVRNHKIHTLNKRVGFIHTKTIQMGEKQAYLGFCTRESFERAIAIEAKINQSQSNKSMLSTAEHLNDTHYAAATRALVRKMISEFCHERLLSPMHLSESTYALTFDGGEYQFNASQMLLAHWNIDSQSIVKIVKEEHGQVQIPLNAQHFVLEFADILGLNGLQLATYLEEVASTLASACFKRQHETLSSSELAQAEFQTLEAAMTEGHPVFIANNGRIGFSSNEYQQFAPECARPVRLLWIAVSNTVAEFTSSIVEQQSDLLANELDITLRDTFNQVLNTHNIHPDNVTLMPVHPWQWQHKLSLIFSSEIANKQIVLLGESDDYYQAQQSIRTFYNISHPSKHYVKVALSILNMGFMRGLSAKYMRVTPAINTWAHSLLSKDATLSECQFSLLQEHSTAGFTTDTFSHSAVGDTPYQKMLAALWRTSPSSLISNDEQLMTMAALLHKDYKGNSLLAALITRSPLSPAQWIQRYLNVYLTPILHCFYKYKLVFMPHGENLILRMHNSVPVGIFMKDIGEEVCLLNADIDLPDNISRICISMPEDIELLSIFTDIFDCIFRFMVEDLVNAGLMSEVQFWTLVSNIIEQYQQAHPELSERFQQYDIFTASFKHSCLNRLQLGNNKQMVDLTDPANSLKFAGELDNPLHLIRSQQFKEAS
ncbi:GNAT family N-acetyltransferase [Aestuariibacter sp. AA17]|uniref:GNAT family N-acetyltransferase n=1 Tax=Fluctibacter corallii TaxID=2984329 RepID=A0ABT3A759_9ALTE|nr:GNAT family N-acetyltransferase [Aestuariibacter sp. AA17]MCV2884417.1 GNAT family N-acetyltransferase [Aestuariibacter sp. AA17]